MAPLSSWGLKNSAVRRAPETKGMNAPESEGKAQAVKLPLCSLRVAGKIALAPGRSDGDGAIPYSFSTQSTPFALAFGGRVGTSSKGGAPYPRARLQQHLLHADIRIGNSLPWGPPPLRPRTTAFP